MLSELISTMPALSLVINAFILHVSVFLAVYSYRKSNPFLFIYIAGASFGLAGSILAILGLVTSSTLALLMSVGLVTTIIIGGLIFFSTLAVIFTLNHFGRLNNVDKLVVYSNPTKGL